MDWDKLKVFHAAAEAGSFTHAGEQLGLSQSAVSRQVSALEQELSVSLFHRHARGLILTEQGDLLFRTAHDVFMQLQAARAKLTDSRERPSGDLKITTTPGRRHQLADSAARRIHRALSGDPDLADRHRRRTRSVDARGRRRDPHPQADAAGPDPAQAVRDGLPRLLLAGIHQAFRHAAHPRGTRCASHHHAQRRQVAPHLQNRNWLIEAGRNGAGPREAYFKVNNILGLVRACQQGLGIAALPDYLVEENNRLVQLFGESDSIQLDTYFVYPEELKSVARVQVFRDFVVSKAQRWPS